MILSKNPIYVLVRGYRAIFLENQAPAFGVALETVVVLFRGLRPRPRLVLQIA